MNNKIKTILAAGLLTLGMAAQACTLGAWDTNVATTALAGGPGETPDIARYQGQCSMQTIGGSPSVKNSAANSATSGPGGETNMIVRFYFLPGAATGSIFEAYSDDGTTAVFTVDYDGNDVNVVPTNGGTTATATAGGTNWHSVEISWAQNGAINLWVDSDATTAAADGTGTSTDAAAVINSASLGGTAGMIFDAYESRRSTPIGRLLRGDSTGEGTINIVDASAVVGEIQGSIVNVGTPDCTQDGIINIIDASCIVGIITNGGP